MNSNTQPNLTSHLEKNYNDFLTLLRLTVNAFNPIIESRKEFKGWDKGLKAAHAENDVKKIMDYSTDLYFKINAYEEKEFNTLATNFWSSETYLRKRMTHSANIEDLNFIKIQVESFKDINQPLFLKAVEMEIYLYRVFQWDSSRFEPIAALRTEIMSNSDCIPLYKAFQRLVALFLKSLSKDDYKAKLIELLKDFETDIMLWEIAESTNKDQGMNL